MDRDLIDFVSSSLDSVWTLELLLLLNAAADRRWTAADLVYELRSSNLVVAQALSRLLAAGLIAAEADDRVHYAPSSGELDALVGRLAKEYRDRPAAIRRIIVMPPDSKLKSFSDAFVFRKPTSND